MATIKTMFEFNKISQSSRDGRRNPWVIGWVASIALVLCVNVTMIVLAFVTNPGLVVDDYYERGRAYEKNALKRIEARTALNWAMNLELPRKILVNVPETYSFTVVDRHSLPLKDASVKIVAYRPSDVDADFSVQVNEITHGHFTTTVSFPLRGIWDLNIRVQHHDGNYDLTRRISVLSQ